MSLYGRRPAVTKTELTTKKIGAAETIARKVGAKCWVERSNSCLGEFLVWFPSHHYVKIDAVKLLDIIEYTDNKEKL